MPNERRMVCMECLCEGVGGGGSKEWITRTRTGLAMVHKGGVNNTWIEIARVREQPREARRPEESRPTWGTNLWESRGGGPPSSWMQDGRGASWLQNTGLRAAWIPNLVVRGKDRRPRLRHVDTFPRKWGRGTGKGAGTSVVNGFP